MEPPFKAEEVQVEVLQSVLVSMGDGVVVVDEQGNFILFNAAAERILGIGAVDSSPDEWSELYGIFYPDTLTPLKTEDLPLVRALRGEEIREHEILIRNPNVPEGVHISVNATPLTDARGTRRGGVAVFRDITIQKRAAEALAAFSETLEQQVEERTRELEAARVEALRNLEAAEKAEDRSREFLESAPDAMVVVDERGTIVLINAQAEKFFGYSRQDLIGQPLELLIPERFRGGHREHQVDYFADARRRSMGGGLELYALQKNGTEVPVEINLSPVESGDGVLVAAAVRDVTARKEAERALRDSEERYRLLFNEMLDGFALHEIICDDQGKPTDYRFLDVNPSFEKATGLNREVIVGKTVREVIPTIEDRWIETYGNVALTGQPTSFENYAEPLGKYFQVSAFSPLPGQFAAIFRDITVEKRVLAALRESEARFRATFECASVGIDLVDVEGKVLDSNGALQRMLGYTKEELATMRFTDFTHAEDAEEAIALYRELIAGGRTSYAIAKRHTRKDGKSIWARVNVSLVATAGGEPNYAIRLVEDITEQKRAEEDLRTLNLELEARVSQRSAALDAANKELEAFSYSVSHDLRAPLRHMTGFVNLLEQHTGSAMDEKARRYAKLIADSAKKMGRLIDDLLEFSRTSRTKLDKRIINLTTLVNEVKRECLRDTPGREIRWKLGPLPKVMGDRSLIRLVLTNLVSNAIKFTRGRSDATIEVGTLRSEDGAVVVFVRDNGAGFNEKYKKKLFGVFQRLHSSEEYEGTGIGLANVKRIIQRHGGEVWAEGQVDEGATFCFSLPNSNGGDTCANQE